MGMGIMRVGVEAQGAIHYHIFILGDMIGELTKGVCSTISLAMESIGHLAQ